MVYAVLNIKPKDEHKIKREKACGEGKLHAPRVTYSSVHFSRRSYTAVLFPRLRDGIAPPPVVLQANSVSGAVDFRAVPRPVLWRGRRKRPPL